MKRFVLDTSAVLRLYLPDGPLPKGLESAVDLAGRGDAVLLAPQLLLAEVAAVLLKKERAGTVNASDAEAILKAVLDLPITLRGHSELALEALDVGRSEGLTSYDALFLVLARREHAELLTGDMRLARRAGGG